MVCSLIWLKGPDSLLQAAVGWGLVIPSVAGSHLLLNLREAYYNPGGGISSTTDGTGWTTTTENHTTRGGDPCKSHGGGGGGGGGGKKRRRTAIFGRSEDILASGGRHRVPQLDTLWALDPEHDDPGVRVDADPWRVELTRMGGGGDDDVERRQHRRGGYGGPTATITTTATIATPDDPPLHTRTRHPLPSKVGGPDAYVHGTRQLAATRSTAPVTDAPPPSRRARRPSGSGNAESYELKHVRSNGSVV
jgi:hypothetical protein